MFSSYQQGQDTAPRCVMAAAPSWLWLRSRRLICGHVLVQKACKAADVSPTLLKQHTFTQSQLAQCSCAVPTALMKSLLSATTTILGAHPFIRSERAASLAFNTVRSEGRQQYHVL